MIFTAYLDETGTHGPAPDIIIAGFVGHDYQWRRFAKELAVLQEKYGFKILHATEFKAKTGEFKDWSDDKCMALVHDVTDLVSEALYHGFAVALPHARFVAEYRATDFPAGMRPDTQYALCMRHCIAHLCDVLENCGKDPRLNIVLEAGHANAGDAERVFKEVKKIYEEAGSNFLDTFATAQKREALPLMVADFLAFAYHLMRKDGDGRKGIPPTAPATELRKERGKTGLAYVEPSGDGLLRLKENYPVLQARRQEIWRRRKEARQGSSGRRPPA